MKATQFDPFRFNLANSESAVVKIGFLLNLNLLCHNLLSAFWEET